MKKTEKIKKVAAAFGITNEKAEKMITDSQHRNIKSQQRCKAFMEKFNSGTNQSGVAVFI